MNQHRLLPATLSIALVLGIASAPRAADFSFGVEPSFPPDRAAEIYQPLLDYLGTATGHRFSLVTTRNYHFHWRDMRSSVPVDFVFEEAHFADYRIQRQGYEPLARTAEPTVYALIAQPEAAERGAQGLVGQRVVSMPSPSLGFVLLMQMYSNPLAQPEVTSSASSWREGVEIVFGGEGEGAMVPERIATLYPNLVEIQRSTPLPGAAVLASASVAAEARQAVREALLALHEDEDLYDVLVEIGATRFEPATAAEYAGAQDLLRGVFGYEAPRGDDPD